MAEESKRPRPKLIKKIKKGGHHGGAWKVAYADFVTAMMALFMVLWILGQSPEVKESISAYFLDPQGIPITQQKNSLLDNKGAGVLDKLPTVSPSGGEGSGPSYVEPIQNAQQEKQAMQKAVQRITQKFMESQELKDLADSIKVEMTDQGMRIELMEKSEGTFFEIGSAQPKESLKKAIGAIISSLPPLDNAITVEGHTDARPFLSGDKGYSNWELSADRANAARRVLLQDGVFAGRITEVRALADRMPLAGVDPLDGRNRRVSLFLQSKFTDTKANQAANQDAADSDNAVPSPDKLLAPAAVKPE